MGSIDRSQHFGSRQDRPGAGYEHDLYLGSLGERAIQREQAAAEGYDFQASGDALAIWEPHNRWGPAIEVQPWRTRRNLQLGESAHCTHSIGS